jgi:uncharacterized lipoprotein YddW (UPF0748 family)
MKKIFLLIFVIISIQSFPQKIIITGQFRGVWISTVKRLDYPSRSGMNSYELKKEFIQILNKCKAIGLNAIIFQIRPAADAFYDSPYEPWSEWLTGKQGQAPYPYFDPLKFMIQQTHKRHMQFHAWINPFRAVATISHSNICKEHISKTKPQWCFTYGNNKYLNPGIPQVRNYVVKIITDIVRRYNIDGIHFDDYFYPYPIRDKNNKIIDIPDHDTFKKYGKGFDNIKDWRRHNINIFIKQVHDSIKAIKPQVKFGVSPPAVWRNKGYDPDGSNTLGLAAYDWLYADVLFWLKNGWLDYVAPQLYWYIGHKRANYSILLKWWAKHNFNTKLYIGLNIHAIDPSRKSIHWGNPNQIPEQIKLALKYKQVKGFILFRYSDLAKNPLGIDDSLIADYFADTSTIKLVTSTILPKTDTLTPHKPIKTDIFKTGKIISIVWSKNPLDSAINHYNIYFAQKKQNIKTDSAHFFASTTKDFYRFELKRKFYIFGKKYKFIITSVSKNNKESKASKPVFIRLKNFKKP